MRTDPFELRPAYLSPSEQRANRWRRWRYRFLRSVLRMIYKRLHLYRDAAWCAAMEYKK